MSKPDGLRHERLNWALAFVVGAGFAVCFHWPAMPPLGVPRAVVLEQVLGLVDARYVQNVDTDDLFHSGLDLMLQQLDPHSKFIAPSEVKDFDATIHGTYDGIGVVIRAPERQTGVRIESVLPQSPAAAAGILAGDEIIGVEGVDVRGATLERVRKLMESTPLSLELIRNGSPPYSVVVKREQITQPSVEALRYYPDEDPATGVGYLRLSQFQPKTAEEVGAACRLLLDHGATRLVIDLRNNRGGMLDEACDLCDLFLREGLLLSTRGRANVDTPVLYRAKEETPFPDLPLVVLIDRGSASAAEIVAAALQDHRRAVLVGDETYGKWTVQDVIALPHRAGKVKLTTKSFHPPGSRWVRRDGQGNRRGIVPQVEVPIDRSARTALTEHFGRESQAHVSQPSHVETCRRPHLDDPVTESSPTGPVDAPLIRALSILDRLNDYEQLTRADPDPVRIGSDRVTSSPSSHLGDDEWKPGDR